MEFNFDAIFTKLSVLHTHTHSYLQINLCPQLPFDPKKRTKRYAYDSYGVSFLTITQKEVGILLLF